MNSAELAANALSQLELNEIAFNPPELDEKAKRNAGRTMQEIVCQRLQAGGERLTKQRGSRYTWRGGIILNRNNRSGGGFWTNVPPSQLEDLRRVMADHPAIFLFAYFEPSLKTLHAWAIPDDVAIRTLTTIPVNQSGAKTVYIKVNEQRIKDALDSPDLRPYYKEIALSETEIEALAAGIKQDSAAKELDAAVEDEDDGIEAETSDYYTQDSVDFLLQLPQHTSDGDWHSANRARYEQTLRDPTRVLVESLRADHVARLDPEVAATNRNISILKKNDYGQGGYQDHYWAAFYDPAAGSKIKSCQRAVAFVIVVVGMVVMIHGVAPTHRYVASPRHPKIDSTRAAACNCCARRKCPPMRDNHRDSLATAHEASTSSRRRRAVRWLHQ